MEKSFVQIAVPSQSGVLGLLVFFLNQKVLSAFLSTPGFFLRFFACELSALSLPLERTTVPHSCAPKTLLDTSNARHRRSVGCITCTRFGRTPLSPVATETRSQDGRQPTERERDQKRLHLSRVTNDQSSYSDSPIHRFNKVQVSIIGSFHVNLEFSSLPLTPKVSRNEAGACHQKRGNRRTIGQSKIE